MADVLAEGTLGRARVWKLPQERVRRVGRWGDTVVVARQWTGIGEETMDSRVREIHFTVKDPGMFSEAEKVRQGDEEA